MAKLLRFSLNFIETKFDIHLIGYIYVHVQLKGILKMEANSVTKSVKRLYNEAF